MNRKESVMKIFSRHTRLMVTVAACLSMTSMALAGLVAPRVARVSSESPHGLRRDADNTANGSGLDAALRMLETFRKMTT